MRKILFCILILLASCADLNKSYVRGDIKTYNAVVPDLVKTYREVQDPLEKIIKLNTINTWTARIEEALKHPEMFELKDIFKPVSLDDLMNDTFNNNEDNNGGH